MKFKIDENLPVDVAVALREFGFEAHTVWDEGLSGALDDMVANRARAEHRVLVTLHLDFASIHVYPPGEYTVIIVLRMKSHDQERVLAYTPYRGYGKGA